MKKKLRPSGILGEKKTYRILSRAFILQRKNKVKQDHNEDVDQNVIWSLNKLNTSYNPASLNYINYKFKNMMLEDTSQEKSLIY